MRRESSFWNTAALGFVLGAVLVTSCTSCVRSVYRTIGQRRTDERAAAVDIASACLTPTSIVQHGGSGVIVGPHSVITAWHVIGCSDARILVTTAGGLVVPMHVDVGPEPEAGQKVCTAPAVPERKNDCGRISWRGDFPPVDVSFDVPTIPGNSGAGIYDSQGHLIGIVTHHRAGGGYGTLVSDMRWAVRP